MTIDQMKEKARERLEEEFREQERLRWEWRDTWKDGLAAGKDLRETSYDLFLRQCIKTDALFEAYISLGLLTREECMRMGRRITYEMMEAHEAKEK